MAFFFGDSFDLYSATNITDAATYWDASLGSQPCFTIGSGRFAGSRGLIANNGTPTAYTFKTSGVNDVVHHVSIAVQQTTALTGTLNGFYFTLYDGATAQCSVAFRSDGAIILTSGGVTGTTLATYTGALAAINTWYQFEIEVVINNTTGSIAVRKLGNTVNDFFLGSLNTRAGTTNNYANKIGLGVGSASVTQLADDFLWRSDAASLAWLGDIRCYTRMPASDASVHWTQSGSSISLAGGTASGNFSFTGATTSYYAPWVSIASGSLSSVTVTSVGTATSATVKCTLFADTGSGPGAILASATSVTNAPLGPWVFSFPSPPSVVAGTKYWIGVCASAASNNFSAIIAYGGVSSSSTAVAYASFPTANPTITNPSATGIYFTVQITSPTNASFVADTQEDGATTYVYSSIVGQSDLYGLGFLSTTPGAIVGVTTRAYMEKSDAGTRIAAVQLQSGSSNVQGSLTLNTTWGWAWRSDQVDPATSAVWTATGVNNAQIGVTVTT